jgi:phage terminase large subunit
MPAGHLAHRFCRRLIVDAFVGDTRRRRLRRALDDDPFYALVDRAARIAYGGRGSGKSHFFGELMVERCLVNPGTLAVCIREVQKSLLQSSKRLIESKIQSLGVGAHFQVLHDRIVTPGMD